MNRAPSKKQLALKAINAAQREKERAAADYQKAKAQRDLAITHTETTYAKMVLAIDKLERAMDKLGEVTP